MFGLEITSAEQLDDPHLMLEFVSEWEKQAGYRNRDLMEEFSRLTDALVICRTLGKVAVDVSCLKAYADLLSDYFCSPAGVSEDELDAAEVASLRVCADLHKAFYFLAYEQIPENRDTSRDTEKKPEGILPADVSQTLQDIAEIMRAEKLTFPAAVRREFPDKPGECERLKGYKKRYPLQCSKIFNRDK